MRPSAVQNISFSKTKYPNIRRHFLDALRKGWPRTLMLNRSGADGRRDRLLAPYPTRPGLNRDEYPPAVGRGKGPGSSAGSTRAAGARTYATCPRTRTAHTARPWGPSCGASATGRAFATSSIDGRASPGRALTGAVASTRGCCTKGSKKLRNLSGGRRIAIRSSGEGLVPFARDSRPLPAWVVPSQIDAPDPRLVFATASRGSESDDALALRLLVVRSRRVRWGGSS